MAEMNDRAALVQIPGTAARSLRALAAPRLNTRARHASDTHHRAVVLLPTSTDFYQLLPTSTNFYQPWKVRMR
jgi:hypothetical protein